MEITTQSLASVKRGLQKLFDKSYQGIADPWWKLVALLTTSTGADEEYHWLGAIPGLREMSGGHRGIPGFSQVPGLSDCAKCVCDLPNSFNSWEPNSKIDHSWPQIHTHIHFCQDNDVDYFRSCCQFYTKYEIDYRIPPYRLRTGRLLFSITRETASSRSGCGKGAGNTQPAPGVPGEKLVARRNIAARTREIQHARPVWKC